MNPKNTRLILSLLLPILFSTTSWSNDTLLYKSNFEKNVFKRTIDKRDIDFIALYAAINSDSAGYQQYLSEIRGFYASLDKKIAGVRAPKQKAKLIFKEVHDHFFIQYEENVYFDNIFQNGLYNCLTASMLYSLVLTKYDIPFEIKEKPTHVYLVAFPGTENILFETTLPKGFYMPDEKARREYVNALVTMKIISQEYVNSVGVPRAFNEFYYNNESITLQQLAGLQYFNEALTFYKEGELTSAITSAIKANTLYPCPKLLYIKTSLIREALSNSTFESLTDVLYLAEFANSSTDVRSKKFVFDVFEDILNNSLIKKGNEKFVTEVYELLQKRVEDTATANEISYTYNLGMGHWHGMKGNMDETLEFAEKAYAVNPNDARLQELIVKAVVLKTEKVRGTNSNIATLNGYAESFPFLKTHKTFRSLMIYQYAFRSYSLFLENSPVEGYKYLKLMEAELKEMDEKLITFEELIGMTYAEAGAYHFRKKEFTKAKEILRQGLHIAPDHGEIKERLKIVENEERY
jgi:tetratricopeptide (TPR) repeat protein